MQEAQIAESQIGIQNWAFCGVNKIRLLFTPFDNPKVYFTTSYSNIKYQQKIWDSLATDIDTVIFSPTDVAV